MVWNRKTFEEFQEKILACASGARPSSGTTFFLYVYDPKEENRCIQNMKQFALSLTQGGHSANVVWMGRLMARILQHRGYSQKALREIEGNRRERLLDPASGLSRARGGLADDIAGALLNGQYEIAPIAGGSCEDVTFLLRTGPLYPFVHVSDLLSRLENQTHHTIGAAFPGSFDKRKEGLLLFLNEGEGRYYRASIIGS